MNNNLKIADGYREKDLFVRRDFSFRQLADRNDSVDAAFCHLHIMPNEIR
jgi:hypothetical protein